MRQTVGSVFFETHSHWFHARSVQRNISNELSTSVLLYIISKPMDEDPAFRVITSLRWIRGYGTIMLEPDLSLQDIKLLKYHRDRLVAAAQTFSWHAALSKLRSNEVKPLTACIRDHFQNPAETDGIEVYKVRLALSKDGTLGAESSVIEVVPADGLFDFALVPKTLDWPLRPKVPCIVYIDTVRSTPSDFTVHKTNFRKPYDEARARAGITHSGPLQAEVLLYNQDQEIMEASLSAAYFFRGGRWLTPSGTCGGNASVTRRLALEAGLCKEGVVTVDQVKEGEQMWLSNAVRGFFCGIIRAGKQE